MSKHTPKRYFDSTGNLIIKPYRMIDLQNIYDVDYKTMMKWIELYQSDIGPRVDRYYTALQISVLIQKIGSPGILTKKSRPK